MKQSPDSASLRYSAPAIPDMIGTYAMSAQVQTTRSRARRRQLQWWRRIVRCLGRRRADPQFTSHLSKCPRLIFAVILATLCAASLSAQTATAHRQPEQRAPGFVPIYAIQGDGLTSPLSKSRVDTYGIVTAVTSNGFYLQDPIGDGLDATLCIHPNRAKRDGRRLRRPLQQLCR